MPRNGSGTYTLPEPPFVAGTIISSAAVNDDFSDIATALTASLPRNGEAGMLGQFKATDGSVVLPGMAFSNDLNTGFYRPADDQIGVVVGGVQVGLFTSGGLQGTLPIGIVLDFAGSTTPTLFILCYGQNVSRTTYAALFAIIGTTFGSGDGVTTFGLPDLRGSAIFGRDDMGGVAASRLTTAIYGTDPSVLGNRGGAQSKQLSTANLPSYTPTGSVSTGTTINWPQNANIARTPAASPPGLLYYGGASAGGADLLVAASTVSATSTSTFTGTAQGGTQTVFALINPALIMNKIIYAGA